MACLAVSEQLSVPPLTDAFLAAADERGFPVVEVPLAVPFMAISQEVAAAVQVDTGQRLNAQLQVFGAVRWLAGGEPEHRRDLRPAGAAVRLHALRLQRRSAGRCWTAFPSRRRTQAKLIPATPASPPTVPGGYVLPVSGPRGTAGYILAMERTDAVPAGVSVVQHIATVAALQLSMQAHEREMLRREGAETLAEMLRGVLDTAVVSRRLAVQGFPAGRPAAAGDRAAEGATAPTRWRTRSPRAGSPQLVLRQEEELYVLVPDDEAARTALAAGDTIVGVSLPFRAGASLAVARREAQWAIRRAVESGRDVVSYGDDRTGRWLTSESADLRALVDDVLRPVIDYDEAHGGDLLPTIRTWLEHDRQTDKAAQALHIHPNTLLYRVRRFEQITGRSLASTEALAETWLALRAAATLSAAADVGPLFVPSHKRLCSFCAAHY